MKSRSETKPQMWQSFSKHAKQKLKFINMFVLMQTLFNVNQSYSSFRLCVQLKF